MFICGNGLLIGDNADGSSLAPGRVAIPNDSSDDSLWRLTAEILLWLSFERFSGSDMSELLF